VVGADDTQSRQLADSFYRQIVDSTVPVGSIATAEAVKLVENTFRNVNIGLANELKASLGAMGIDVWAVIEAAATKPFGFMPFYPGPGIGGDCIPVSPAYLAWRARDVGRPMPISGSRKRAPASTTTTGCFRCCRRRGTILPSRDGNRFRSSPGPFPIMTPSW
jgi:UDP-N-acetyl-D-glucosamine dehydrogenase